MYFFFFLSFLAFSSSACSFVVVGDVLGLELGLVQRDRVPGLAIEELLDPLVVLLELGVGLAALRRALVEQGHQVGGDLVVVVVGQFGHLVELDGVIHLALAEVHVSRIEGRWMWGVTPLICVLSPLAR